MELNGRYFLTDYESGMQYEVSKEYYERHNAWMKELWEQAMAKLPKPIEGAILIFGTGGDLEEGDSFKKFFNDPSENPFTNIWPEDPVRSRLTKYFHPVNKIEDGDSRDSL